MRCNPLVGARTIYPWVIGYVHVNVAQDCAVGKKGGADFSELCHGTVRAWRLSSPGTGQKQSPYTRSSVWGTRPCPRYHGNLPRLVPGNSGEENCVSQHDLGRIAYKDGILGGILEFYFLFLSFVDG